MSEKTEISYVDSTSNPAIGCSGCELLTNKPGEGCYAKWGTNARIWRKRGVETFGPGGTIVPVKGFEKSMLAMNRRPWVCDDCGSSVSEDSILDIGHVGPMTDDCKCEDVIAHPAHRRRVFVTSQCDWLDPRWPASLRAHVFDVIRRCENLTIIACTKQPQLWRELMRDTLAWSFNESNLPEEHDDWMAGWIAGGSLTPKNLWLLTTVEDQKTADERIPRLLRIPAVVRGLSCEPLLGPIDLNRIYWPDMHGGDKWESVLTESISQQARERYECLKDLHQPTINYVIAGGESGKNSRPCKIEWLRSLRDQCKAAGVQYFCKQLGANIISSNDAGFEGESPTEWPMDTYYRELDPMEYQGAPVRVVLKHRPGADPAEWPEDLRVRQFPTERT